MGEKVLKMGLRPKTKNESIVEIVIRTRGGGTMYFDVSIVDFTNGWYATTADKRGRYTTSKTATQHNPIDRRASKAADEVALWYNRRGKAMPDELYEALINYKVTPTILEEVARIGQRQRHRKPSNTLHDSLLTEGGKVRVNGVKWLGRRYPR